MSLRGVNISEGNIGVNQLGDAREFGLIGNGIAIAGKLDLGVAYILRRIQDAESLGITAEYDDANNVHVHRHISEFYRNARPGRKLNIMLVADTIALKDMVTDAKNLIVNADGMISDLGFFSNSTAPITLIDGIPTGVSECITELQKLAQWAATNDMPLHTIVEGFGISDTLSNLADLRDFQVIVGAQPVKVSATKVSMVIAQDWEHAETFRGNAQKYADVGTFLGVVASHAWNRNPGEVETKNIQNVSLGTWRVGGLSNHKKYTEVFESLETLNDKGYIIPVKYQGKAGYWFNDGATIAPIIIDVQGNMNQHTIYYSHTLDESVRALRQVYLPEIKKPVPLIGGLMPIDMVEYYNAIGDAVFKKFASAGLISEGKTNVDPLSDLLGTKILNVQFTVVPTGTIDELVGNINLKTSL
ncbi:DUF2586 family protein [Flavobacterium sp. LS1R47]|uniref:DUF2586 family protein n=1 Tax=Flavobacterium frigoritolerans TaxID=2987686 RepID=A0A9X3CAD1_9FLAO|nr:DUF2586 family protein [Flavobacterium frigoritolerans]MCV9934544.1 DUF2586 family protein [Flavobacterium frigoritolerans]